MSTKVSDLMSRQGGDNRQGDLETKLPRSESRMPLWITLLIVAAVAGFGVLHLVGSAMIGAAPGAKPSVARILSLSAD